MRECSPPQTCHMSCVTCHMSRVTCHVSPVTCHLSPVTCKKIIFQHFNSLFLIFKFFLRKQKIGQSGGASRWRVCYQRGLPRLVSRELNVKINNW